MILGIGCDVVRISRMLKIVPVFKKGMQQHILSDKEQDELSTKDFNDNQISRFLAKRFAAKEALSKALGTGFINGMHLRDITISHDELGCPYFELRNKTLDTLIEKAKEKDFKIHLTISDDADLAQAFVVIELI